MVRLILSGCNGHMGRAVANLCDADPELEVAAGIDVLGQPGGQFPVYSSPAACPVPGDVLVDFSHPSALDALLEFCLERSMPAVLATTGYSEQQLEQIGRAAGRIPVFRSANFSLGVNLLMDLVRRAAAALGISPNGWCNGKGRKRPREKKWTPPAATGRGPVQMDITV